MKHDDGIFDDDHEIIDLVDIGSYRSYGKRKNSLHNAAKNHFNNYKYLSYIKSNYLCFDDIEEEYFKDEILGKFSDYLIKCVPSIKKYNTHDNYVSAIHVMITDKYPAKRIEFERYYIIQHYVVIYLNTIKLLNIKQEERLLKILS